MPLFSAGILSATVIADFGIRTGIPIEKLLQIFNRGMGDVIQRFFREESLVGCDDYVWHGDQPDQLVIPDDVENIGEAQG